MPSQFINSLLLLIRLIGIGVRGASEESAISLILPSPPADERTRDGRGEGVRCCDASIAACSLRRGQQQEQRCAAPSF